MIEEFTKLWFKDSYKIKALFEKSHPEDYKEIVKNVVSILPDLDPERIHEINDGEYEGTLIFVIGEPGYIPRQYWVVSIEYGSCSTCDTLEGIREYSDELPTPEQVDQYMTLALHIVQRMKEI